MKLWNLIQRLLGVEGDLAPVEGLGVEAFSFTCSP
jgi:hypothetical protein